MDMERSAVDVIFGMIKDVHDYPKKGVVFRDLTPMLKDGKTFALCIDELARRVPGNSIDYVVGIESRGFIVGSALAYAMGVGFIPVRKEGKLPRARIRREYSLEYGNAVVEIHKDAIEPGSRVLIADDLLATGGTAKATAELVEELGGKIVGFAFIVEIGGLGGREKLKGRKIFSLVKY